MRKRCVFHKSLIASLLVVWDHCGSPLSLKLVFQQKISGLGYSDGFSMSWVVTANVINSTIAFVLDA